MAGGQFNAQRAVSAFLLVVILESTANIMCLHAHDRVSARIERGILVEDLHTDDVFLELVAVPAERLEAHELEESLQPIDLPEGRARQNPIQLLPTRLVAGGSDGTHRQPQY